MKLLHKSTATTALSALLLALATSASAAELTISATTTADALTAEHPDWVLAQHPGMNNSPIVMYSASGNTLTLEDDSRELSPTLSILLAGGGSTTDQDVINNAVNISNTAYAKTVYGGILSAGTDANDEQIYLSGDVSGNKVSVTSSAVASVRAAQAMHTKDSDLYGNTIEAEDCSATGNLYGARLTYGSGALYENNISFNNSQTTKTLCAAYSGNSTGDVYKNNLALNDSTSSGILYAAYLTNTSGNACQNSLALTGSTIDNLSVAAYVSEAAGNLDENSITLRESAATNTMYAAYAINHSGNASGNTILLEDSSSKSLRAVYFIYSSGNITNNSITINNSTVTEAYAAAVHSGKSTCSGDLIGNSVTLDQGSKGEDITGAGIFGYFVGEASENTATVKGGSSATAAYGAHVALYSGDGVNIKDNQVIITEGSSLSDCAVGGYSNFGGSLNSLTGNSVTISGGSSVAKAVGGKGEKFLGDISHNSVSVTDSHVTGDVQGAYGQGGGSVSANSVHIATSTVGGSVYGGYSRDGSDSSENTVTLDSSTVKGDIYGGYIYNGSGNVSNNTVVLKSTTEGGDLSAANICGGGGSAATISGNTLKMEGFNGAIGSVSDFDAILQTGGSATIMNGKLEAGVSLTVSEAELLTGADDGNLSISGVENVFVTGSAIEAAGDVIISSQGALHLSGSSITAANVTIGGSAPSKTLDDVHMIVNQGGTADLRYTLLSGTTSISSNAVAFSLEDAFASDDITVLLEGSTLMLDSTNCELTGSDGAYTINASGLFSGVDLVGSFTLNIDAALSESISDYELLSINFGDSVQITSADSAEVTIAMVGQTYSAIVAENGSGVNLVQPSSVPEPTTSTLGLLALAALAARRRRK